MKRNVSDILMLRFFSIITYLPNEIIILHTVVVAGLSEWWVVDLECVDRLQCALHQGNSATNAHLQQSVASERRRHVSGRRRAKDSLHYFLSR